MKTKTWNEREFAAQCGLTMIGRSIRAACVSVRPARRLRALLGLLCLSVAWGAIGARGAAVVVQEFYMPMPEAQVYAVFNKHAPFDPPDGNFNMKSIFSIVVTTPNTMVVYDHWEDGYESDINAPTDASTEIWGDGNDANGICPGFGSDPFGLPGGAVIALQSLVPAQARGADILYDGGDRVGATRAVTIARACYESSQRGAVQASSVEVISTLDHGRQYIAPVGIDVSTNGIFRYVDLMIMADETNTTVVVDKDGTGTTLITNVIGRGANGAFLVEDISKGATVSADKPVQVHMITGDTTYGQFETRSFVLRPVELWSSTYIIPIGTMDAAYPGFAYLFNTSAVPLNVTYTTHASSGTLTVPGANGLLRFRIPDHSGTLLKSDAGSPFFVICAMNTDPVGETGTDFDWGFAPIPFEGLTTELVCGWGPGWDLDWILDPGKDPPVNGNPVWVTALTNTTLYVDFDGDGGPADTNFTVNALEVTRIYDMLDDDQTGMRIYTLDGTVITGVWGEDPSSAYIGPPNLDLGYALPPFPVTSFSKTSVLVPEFDTAPTNVLNVGDVVEYTLRVSNRGLLPLGNLFVFDSPPFQLSYVTNSYVLSNGVFGTTLDGAGVIDDDINEGSSFPLDGNPTEYRVPVIKRNAEVVFKYRCKIVSPGSIVNIGLAGDPGPDQLVSTNQVFAYTLVSVSSNSVIEGNVGTTNLVFPVTLSSEVVDGESVHSVEYYVINGTATTADNDYVVTNGTLFFYQGTTNYFIEVMVNGDLNIESNETLFVILTNGTGSVLINDGRATGTIIDDDYMDISNLFYRVEWVYNPRRDSWYGTLTLSNATESTKSLAVPLWYEVRSNRYHRLRFPTGVDTVTTPAESGWYYLDLSAAFNANVPGGKLDPGQSAVISTNIEVWGRSSWTTIVDRVVATNWVVTPAGGVGVNKVVAQEPVRVVAAAGPVISGRVTRSGTKIGVAGVTVVLSNGGGTTKTDAVGNFSVVVPSGWKGTVTPSLSGGTCSPRSRTVKTKVTASKAGQNFSWKARK